MVSSREVKPNTSYALQLCFCPYYLQLVYVSLYPSSFLLECQNILFCWSKKEKLKGVLP